MTGRLLLGLTVAYVAGLTTESFVPPGVPLWLLLGAAMALVIVMVAGLFPRCHACASPPLFAFIEKDSAAGFLTRCRAFGHACAHVYARCRTILNILLPLVCFCTLGVVAARLATPVLPAPASLDPFFERPRTLFMAQVSAPPVFYPDKMRLPLSLRSAFLDGRAIPVEGGVLLTLERPQRADTPWITGDRLMVRLTLKRYHNFSNPGGFDYVRAQAEQGLYARAYVGDSRLLVKLAREADELPSSAAIHYLKSSVEGFRQHALHWLEQSLEPETGALYAALLLGYQRLVPNTLQEHLIRSGVTHLLAISGQHLALVSIMTFWLACRIVRFLVPSVLERTSDKHFGLWAAILAAFLYAFLTGLATPTWRALIMLTLILGASYWYRSTDIYSAMALAAILILVISPGTLWQVSFQLSFGAVLGLVLLYPRFKNLQNAILGKGRDVRGNLPRRLIVPFADAFWVSMAANLMVLPIVVYHFHGFSLAAVAANTVLVPLVGFLALPLGLTSLVLYTVSEKAALVVLKLGAIVLEFSRDVAVWFSGLSWAFFWAGAIPAIWLVCFYLFTALLLSHLRRSVKIICLVVTLLSLLVISSFKPFHTRHNPQELRVTFLDVGQGTSTFIRFPSGETMLVDGGGFYDDSYDPGRSVVAPFLWESGVRRLDYVVLSHDHPDHRNGLKFILSHFSVKDYWESGITENPAGRTDLLEIASRRGISVTRLPEILNGKTIGECRVHILHPDASYVEKVWEGQDLNNVSLVIRIDYGATRLILPGDIDQSVENRIFSNHDNLDRYNVGPVLLASPHHGSVRSNGGVLFNSLSPESIVFSCGYDNWFGFPSPAVLQKCRAHGVPYYRTDLQGAIQAVSDGTRWVIEPTGSSPGIHEIHGIDEID